MPIPTRDELHAEVDRRFRDHFPSAPERLDPDEADHRELVDEWLNLRDSILNDWTNETFYEFCPEFGYGNKIDPSNPQHKTYMEYWLDIQYQIKEGHSGRYDWSGNPPSAPAHEPESAVEASDLATPTVDGAAEGSAPVGKDRVKLGRIALHPDVVDGTSVLDVDVKVHELEGVDVPEAAVWVSITADPYDVKRGEDDDTTQRRAHLSYNVPAIAARGEYYGRSRLQVDPGTWHVEAELWSGGAVLDTSEGDVTVEGRQRGTYVPFPDDAEIDIALAVTRLARVSPTLFEVHFTVTNRSADAPVPAGLPVTAWLQSGDASEGTSQDFHLPDPIPAGRTIDMHLTIGGHASGPLTATVLVQLTGRSFESDPFEVDASDVPDRPKPRPRVGPEGGDGGETESPEPTSYNLPDIDPNDPDFEQKVKDWTYKILVQGVSKTAAIIEIAEFFARHGGRIARIAAYTTPVGYVLDLVQIFGAVIKAFGVGLETQRNRGLIFGMMWQTLGMADIQWTSPGLNSLGLPDDPFHSDKELADAFYEGVSGGRRRALEPEVAYNLGMAIAVTMRNENVSREIAANLVMGQLFRQLGRTRHEDFEYP